MSGERCLHICLFIIVNIGCLALCGEQISSTKFVHSIPEAQQTRLSKHEYIEDLQTNSDKTNLPLTFENQTEDKNFAKKLTGIKHYYRKFFKGNLKELPKLSEIEKDKAYLTHILNQISKKENIDEKIKDNLKTLITDALKSLNSLVLLSRITNHPLPTSNKSVEQILNDKEMSKQNLSIFNSTLNIVNTGKFKRKSNEPVLSDPFIQSNIPVGISILDVIEHSNQNYTNTKDVINKDRSNSKKPGVNLDNSSFLKRMGEAKLSTTTKEKSSSDLQLHHFKSNTALGLLPNSPISSVESPATWQGSLSGLPSKGAAQLSSSSPLDIIDNTPSLENAAYLLLDLFLKDAGALKALEEYLSVPPSSFVSPLLQPRPSSNNNLPTSSSTSLFNQPLRAELMGMLKTPIQSQKIQNSNVPSDTLADLMVRLDIPSAGEIAQAVPVTRFSPELVTAITNFINNLAAAITQFLQDLQNILTENPLLAALLGLALFGILWHIFQKKKGYGHKHGYKGGGGGGGYHRSWEPQFRNFDDSGQHLTVSVLNKLEAFEKWLVNSKPLNKNT